jgi:hypothetical protein
MGRKFDAEFFPKNAPDRRPVMVVGDFGPRWLRRTGVEDRTLATWSPFPEREVLPADHLTDCRTSSRRNADRPKEQQNDTPFAIPLFKRLGANADQVTPSRKRCTKSPAHAVFSDFFVRPRRLHHMRQEPL